jgi:hypothetical protein
MVAFAVNRERGSERVLHASRLSSAGQFSTSVSGDRHRGGVPHLRDALPPVSPALHLFVIKLIRAADSYARLGISIRRKK